MIELGWAKRNMWFRCSLKTVTGGLFWWNICRTINKVANSQQKTIRTALLHHPTPQQKFSMWYVVAWRLLLFPAVKGILKNGNTQIADRGEKALQKLQQMAGLCSQSTFSWTDY